MTQIAKVAVAAATYAIDKPYDYLVPSGMELSVGCRVTVPFGRGNRTAEGMVLQLRQEVPAKPLKAIRNLLDQEPVLTEKEIRLALWMRQRYFCTFYDALHTILPAAVWYRYREIWSLCPVVEEEGLTEREQAVCRMLSDGPQERETLCTVLGEDIPSVLYQMKKKGLVSVETETSRKVKDHMVELASLAAPAQEVLERLERRRRSAPRQYEAAAFLAKCGETTVHDLCYFTGATRQTLRRPQWAGFAVRSAEVSAAGSPALPECSTGAACAAATVPWPSPPPAHSMRRRGALCWDYTIPMPRMQTPAPCKIPAAWYNSCKATATPCHFVR